MNEKIIKTLEFEKIRAKVAGQTRTDYGKKLALTQEPLTDSQVIQQLLDQTDDAMQIIRYNKYLPIAQLDDLSVPLKRLAAFADLNAKELLTIKRCLEIVRDLKRFLDNEEQIANELKELPALIASLVSLPDIRSDLARSIADDASIYDDATPKLKSIRQSIRLDEQKIKETLENYTSYKYQKYLSEPIVTLRNDRYVIPVKSEYKHKFGGIVHDQSSSGQTVYVEPQKVITMGQELANLKTAEREEIQQLLYELSVLLVPYQEEIANNIRVIGKLDYAHAKAQYATAEKMSLPLLSKDRYVRLKEARHPLLALDKAVKNDIIIGQDYQAILITGPNTGGKTVLLKTLGLVQLMAQSGLFIPANEESTVGIFDNIFADIGDEQSIEQNLSTFSSHMSNIVSILNSATDKSLILLDEIGSGTDPQEGAAIATAILDYIGTLGSYVVASTHYPELKSYGYHHANTINASMTFDSDTLAPTYHLVLGVPGRSNAIDISRRLGMPEVILQQAKSGLTDETQDLNRVISDLEEKRAEAEKEQRIVEKNLAESDKLLKDLKAQTAFLKKNKDRLIAEAKEEANAMVAAKKLQADQLIASIRSLQKKANAQQVKEHELIAKQGDFNQLTYERKLQKNKVLNRAKSEKSLKAGDEVEVISFGQTGVLLEKTGPKEWAVQMGIVKMKLPEQDFRVIDRAKKEKPIRATLKGGSSSHVKTSLDLRGKRYEEAMKDLDQYLDAALLANYPRVTIIHGKGTGAIKDAVWKVLRRNKAVKHFEFAPQNQGGSGATIAELG